MVMRQELAIAAERLNALSQSYMRQTSGSAKRVGIKPSLSARLTQLEDQIVDLVKRAVPVAAEKMPSAWWRGPK